MLHSDPTIAHSLGADLRGMSKARGREMQDKAKAKGR